MNKTADGVEIVDGLAAWNNNLDLCMVKVGDRERSGGFDGWYDTVVFLTWDDNATPEGARGPIMNGERLTTRHPFTGEMAADRLALISDTCVRCGTRGSFAELESNSGVCGACIASADA